MKYKKVPNNENAIEIDGKVVLSFDPRYKEYLKWRDENPDLEQQLIDDLEHEIRNKELYNNGAPHESGDIQEWYNEDGQLILSQKDGCRSTYYENGQKESEETFKDGKRDGLGTWWYDNGQKKNEFTWKDGKVDGTWKWYWSNGTKMKEGNWKDSKLDGLWTEWNENGRKKIKGINKDGRRDGLWTWWYENGQKKEEVTFKDGEMISGKKWNKDGTEKE